MVAGDHHEDFARAGNCDAQPAAHCLPGGFGGRQPALPGRHLPGTIRGGPHLPLQLADAAQAAHSADGGGDGAVHRGRRISSGAERLHHYGGRHQFHGAGRSQPGEGRDRPGDRFGTAGRRADAHHGERRGALSGEGRCRVPGAHTPAVSPVACRGSGLRGRHATGARRGGTARGAAGRPSHAVRDRRRAVSNFRFGRLCRIPAGLCTGDAVRERAAGGPAGRRDRQSPRFPERAGRAAHRRHHLRGIGEEGGVFRGGRRAAGHAAGVSAGCLGLHGGAGGGTGGHHPRGRRDGGDDELRHRAEDRGDAESRERRRVLRDGGAGLRPPLHVQLADGADRRDGGRVGGGGAVLGRTGEV